MRLYRHDELVEAMARQLFIRRCGGMLPDYIEDSRMDTARSDAAAALDALLEAAVELEVGQAVRIVDNPENDGLSKIWSSPEPTDLILRMEASDDK